MDEFIGIVKIFAGTFAPVGWLPCDGRLLPISQYDTLYALLGTQYGGDGVNTFGLPDLRSSAAVGAGNTYQLGSKGGSDTVTLTIAQLPQHIHPANVGVNIIPGTTNSPQGNLLSQAYGSTPSGNVVESFIYEPEKAQSATVNTAQAATVLPIGESQPHNNMQPYLGMMYCICVEGIWPSQN